MPTPHQDSVNELPHAPKAKAVRLSPESFVEVASYAVNLMLSEVSTRLLVAPEQGSAVKTDNTLVGIADRESGKIGRTYLQVMFPGVAFKVEDVGESLPAEQRPSTVILLDPLDGTRPWTNGFATSSVIVSAYDLATKQIFACVIGEVTSNGGIGRIWRSYNGRAELCLPHGTIVKSQVWNGALNTQATVCIDNAKGFKRNEREIFSEDQYTQLLAKLSKQSHLAMLGSNGTHQALVASGGSAGRERLAGGITTALGGAWDVAGAHLIINSGGAAQGLSFDTAGQMRKINPLQVFDYDVLVYGNSTDTVEALTALVSDSCGRVLV